jgi:hypothetical protein
MVAPKYLIEWNNETDEYFIRMDGIFTLQELQSIVFDIHMKQIDDGICPWCYRLFGSGHLKDCPYLIPDRF